MNIFGEFNPWNYDILDAANQAQFWKFLFWILAIVSPFIMMGIALVLARKMILLIIAIWKKASGGGVGGGSSFKSNREERESREDRAKN